MTRKSMGRASVAGLSIAAVAGLGLGTAPFAFAQDETTSAAVPAPAAAAQCDEGTQADFDANKDVKFTIHKYAKEDGKGGEDNNGKKLSEEPTNEKLSGVEFTVQKVNAVDYSSDKNAAQQKAAELIKAYKDAPTAEKLAKLGDLGAGEKLVTDEGVISKDFKPGLYLVSETATPAGVTPAAPFLVNLPLTDQTNRACWNYDVHVYPKNSKTENPDLGKTVKDVTAPGSAGTAEAANSAFIYTVSADVKPAANGYAKFQLIDPLAPELTHIEKGAKDIVKLKGAPLDAADYEMFSVEKDGLTWATVGLTKSGLEKLGTDGGKVEWVIQVEAKDTTGLTKIHNVASNIAVPKVPEGTPPTDPNYPPDPEKPNNPDPKNPFNPKEPPTTPDPKNPTPPGETTPEVDTYYGKLKFTKVGTPRDEAEKKNLKGAKFEVYECAADKNLNGEHSGKPVSVDGKTVFESDENGDVVIDGLLVNDFRNNSEFVNGTDGTTWAETSFYCLKETEAPEGFEKLPDMVQFQVLKNGNVVFNGSEPTLGTDSKFELVNQPKNNGFNLPLTGGAGIAPMVVVGGLLIAGSGAYVAAASRRKKQS